MNWLKTTLNIKASIIVIINASRGVWATLVMKSVKITKGGLVLKSI